MTAKFRDIEEFILSQELPNLEKYLDKATTLERNIFVKLIIILANANIKLNNSLSIYKKLPVASYLLHDISIKIELENNSLEDWLGIESCHLQLKKHSLPNIDVTLSDHLLEITVSDSPISWAQLANLTNNISASLIPRNKEDTLVGKIDCDSAAFIVDSSVYFINDNICLLLPNQDFSQFVLQFSARDSYIKDHKLSPFADDISTLFQIL